MTGRRTGQGFIEIPHAAVYLLLTVNIVVYGLCLNQSAGPAIPAEVLYRYGAMYSLALQRHEYWRLVTYGFLHFNLVHLASNMLCLVLWGGHLEKRVGPAYFLFIYAWMCRNQIFYRLCSLSQVFLYYKVHVQKKRFRLGLLLLINAIVAMAAVGFNSFSEIIQ